MHFSVLLCPVVLPVLFWAGYHYYKDRHLPEPLAHLLIAFGLGVVSFFLGKWLYEALGYVNLRYDAYALAEESLVGLFTYAVLAIGTIEELVKLLPFLLVVLRFEEFDEPIDGIIYASFIALGFSAVENIQYLQFLSTTEALARGFAGPVVHIVFASIWGYYVGRAWLRRENVFKTLLAALAATALLHGIYDFIVIALPPPALPVAALIVLAIWVWRLALIRDLHAKAPAQGAGGHGGGI